MRITEVTYAMAEPAKRLDVLLWLITGGNKGKLFVSVDRQYNKFHAAQDGRTYNCRSIVSPVLKSCGGSGGVVINSDHFNDEGEA